jgi:uncharacterized membrane protein YtjA (UPF0391 family)|tara:strand:- start:1060 stop:1380 length:321 start_codon:yes stop_codon:yes gene_type:complete
MQRYAFAGVLSCKDARQKGAPGVKSNSLHTGRIGSVWTSVRPLANEFEKETAMLRLAIAFLVIALIAAVLGFGGIAGASVGIAKIVFLIFIVLFVIGAIAHFMRRA